jgi:hypothetical protein
MRYDGLIEPAEVDEARAHREETGDEAAGHHHRTDVNVAGEARSPCRIGDRRRKEERDRKMNERRMKRVTEQSHRSDEVKHAAEQQ